MGPKHGEDHKDIQEVTVSHIFLLMGASLIELPDAPAGTIVGLGGLDAEIVKLATLTSSPFCPNFIKIKAISMGLIKVAIETDTLSDMELLKEKLKKLDKSDPSV